MGNDLRHMNILKRYKEIPKNEWLEHSQKMELEIWKNSPSIEDRNLWWRSLFNDYKCIEDEKITSILEVGCGPFAWNIQFVINSLKEKPIQIYLNDPLLSEYIYLNKPVTDFINKNNVIIHSCPLEELNLEPVDMIISINVLDHVFNLNKCFESIYNNLKFGGIFIFGNDLTNETNFKNTPKNDPYGMLHPIRFDHIDIKPHIEKYEKIFKEISSSKNSTAHYGTLLFIGRKK